jgi:hypothetical protein
VDLTILRSFYQQLCINKCHKIAAPCEGAAGEEGNLSVVCEKFIKKEPDTIADVGILYAICIPVDLLSGC